VPQDASLCRKREYSEIIIYRKRKLQLLSFSTINLMLLIINFIRKKKYIRSFEDLDIQSRRM